MQVVVRPVHADARPLGSIARRPLVSYFVLTFVFSWTLWIPWALGAHGGVGAVLFLLGGLGPLAAAGIVTRATGGSLRAWARGWFRWRVPPRFYVYALGLPPAVLLVVNLVLASLGREVDVAALPGRVPAYLVSVVVIAIVGGGLEEPGWRGFALPKLQARWSPFRATLVLGFVWGVWHIPAYGTPIALVFPLMLAFLYTWLANVSGSVLLCILLHGGITASIDQLLLVPDSTAVDIAIFGSFAMAALVVIALTRGRLGGATGSREVAVRDA